MQEDKAFLLGKKKQHVKTVNVLEGHQHTGWFCGNQQRRYSPRLPPHPPHCNHVEAPMSFNDVFNTSPPASSSERPEDGSRSLTAPPLMVTRSAASCRAAKQVSSRARCLIPNQLPDWQRVQHRCFTDLSRTASANLCLCVAQKWVKLELFFSISFLCIVVFFVGNFHSPLHIRASGGLRPAV